MRQRLLITYLLTAVQHKNVDSKMYNELPLKEFSKPNSNLVKSKESGATLKTIWLHLVSPRKSTRSPLKISASVIYLLFTKVSPSDLHSMLRENLFIFEEAKITVVCLLQAYQNLIIKNKSINIFFYQSITTSTKGQKKSK